MRDNSFLSLNQQPSPIAGSPTAGSPTAEPPISGAPPSLAAPDSIHNRNCKSALSIYAAKDGGAPKRPEQPDERQAGSRRYRGQSTIELVMGLIVAVPIILCLIDLGIIAMGASANDSVCREAAAAAGSGPPSTDAAPSKNQLSAGKSGYDLAVSVIKIHQPTNVPAKVTDTPVVIESLVDVPPPDQGGAVDGDIAVTTTVVITPPFLVGAYFGSRGVSVASTHDVPFTYIVPKVAPPPS